MKTIKFLIKGLTATTTIPLMSLVGCNQNAPIDTYTISGGLINLTGKAGQAGGDISPWVVKNSKQETVAAILSLESVEPFSVLPDWIQLKDGIIKWSDDAVKGTYKFKIKAAIGESEPIYSDEITLDISEADFEWSFDTTNNTATLIQYNGIDDDVVIPSSIENKGVSYTVTSIGNSAFYNSIRLKTIKIPNSVTSIGDWAFCDCNKLISIDIPDSITHIGSVAFALCSSLTSVTIPDSVTTISNHMFAYCSNLTTIITHDGITNIGESAFEGCTKLSQIEFPNSVINIGRRAFFECTCLETVTIVGNLTNIGTEAFAYCSSLTKVIISDSIENIGEGAFANCSSLADSSDSNNTQGFQFFGPIEQWELVNRGPNWHVDTPATIIQCNNGQCSLDKTSDFEWKFNKLNNTAMITGYVGLESHIIIPSSIKKSGKTYTVTSIGDNAFNNCNNIISIIIPNSVSSIGAGAFAYCSSLTTATIPDGIPYIGDNTYAYCSSLTTIAIPDSITNIGVGAFRGCTSLREMKIPAAVTNIGQNAFTNCSNLTDDSGHDGSPGFKFLGSVGQWKLINRGANWHADTPATQIQCSSGKCGLDEKSTFQWQYNENNTATLTKYINSSGEVLIPSSIKNDDTTYKVDSIGIRAFYFCSGLNSLIIPDGVTTIDKEAMIGCTDLTSITIPNSVTNIGQFAFYGCFSLPSITIPTGIKNIDNSTFMSCSSLETVIIPDNVESIGDQAFDQCYCLTNNSGPDGGPGFRFLGTIKKWKSINRGINWHCSSATQVQCIDGQCGLDEQ